MLSRVTCSTCTDHDVHQDHRACGGPPTPGNRPAKTSVPSSIGPTAPPRDTPNDTNMADETRRRVRSMVLDRICRCLRRLQAPHVYSTSSYSSKRYTWDQGSSSPAFQPAKTPAVRTIEPTRGAPGRGVVHPMSPPRKGKDAFAGLMFHVL